MEARELIQQGLHHFGIPGSSAVVERLHVYAGELDRWNRRVNLTGKEGTEPIIRELLYDALFLFPTIGRAGSVLDAGSGNGVLAITFACLDEDLHVYSVDKNLKKIQFQRHVKRTLGLQRLTLVHGRIETLPPLNVNAAVAKAFGKTDQVLDMLHPHLVQGGSVYLPRGTGDEQEGGHPGYALEQAFAYALPGSPKRYRLLQYKKIS